MKSLKNLFILCTIICLCGCNEADDVQAIFTGKMWKLTYITKKDSNKWYKFPDVSDANYEQYVKGSTTFFITFTGSTSDNITQGSMTGAGSVLFTGEWSANGKSRKFSSSLRESKVMDPNDRLGNRIIQGFKNGTSYEGNANNLFIYFKPDDADVTLCMAFAPKR